MANILDELDQEIPSFPTGANIEQQLEFLYEQIVELNNRLTSVAADAPVGTDSATLTTADSPAKTVTVTDGIITNVV
jgi:hypothetical protein